MSTTIVIDRAGELTWWFSEYSWIRGDRVLCFFYVLPVVEANTVDYWDFWQRTQDLQF